MEVSNLIQICVTIILNILFNTMGQTSGATPPGAPAPNQAAQLPQTLNIAVPVTAFKEYVNLAYDTNGSVTEHNAHYDGFSIKVFQAAIQSAYIGSNLPTINFHYYAKPDGTLNGSFDTMLQAVSLQEYDGAVGDISIRFGRSQWVDFTLPYSETGISIMVSANPNKITGIKVMSLIKGLVYAAFALCFISAFIFWIVEFCNDKNRRPHASLGSNTPAQRAHNDEYWRRETLRAIIHTRLVIVLWFLVLLFLASCYTASLTSLLTAQRHRTPIRTLDELIRTKAHVGVLTGSFIHDVLSEKGFSDNHLRYYSSEPEMMDMLSKGSAPGGVVAVIEETAYLKVFLSKYCNKGYTLVPSFNIRSEGFGFAFQKGHSSLVSEISKGILRIIDNGTMADIQQKTIGDLETCWDGANISSVDSDTLDADTTWILFVGAIGVAILVLIVYMVFLGTTCDTSKKRFAYPCYLMADYQERKS